MSCKYSKTNLIELMNRLGFYWICDVNYENRVELVASKMNDNEKLWWRPVEVEGSGFTRLFKGSIRNLWIN